MKARKKRMVSHRIGDLSPDELREMQAHMGRMLMNLPLASTLAGHSRPLNTLRGNYLHVSPSDSRPLVAAKQFLTEISMKDNAAMLERWYPRDWEDRFTSSVGAALAPRTATSSD